MRTIYWDNGIVVTIDQSLLPQKLVHLKLKDCKEIAKIIKEMKVRGAPLIGVTAAFGLALAAYNSKARSREELIKELEASAGLLRSTRPTAVNLFWAIDRMLRTARATKGSVGHVSNAVVEEAIKMAGEDVEMNKAIAETVRHYWTMETPFSPTATLQANFSIYVTLD